MDEAKVNEALAVGIDALREIQNMPEFDDTNTLLDWVHGKAASALLKMDEIQKEGA